MKNIRKLKINAHSQTKKKKEGREMNKTNKGRFKGADGEEPDPDSIDFQKLMGHTPLGDENFPEEDEDY